MDISMSMNKSLMLTDSDLDAGLVELDGGGPGDETGTEKQDLVRGHDCGCDDVLVVRWT